MNELMHTMQEQIDACDKKKKNDSCDARMFFFYIDGHSNHLP